VVDSSVFASPSTWYRLVRRYRWRRPRRRVHPAKPKIGIHASTPNEIWHIDTTVIRLLDGTRAYLHAVLDNVSRRILAWRASDRLDPANTVSVLVEASQVVGGAGDRPMLLADSGVET
jgi:transposase InsO family protein